MFVLFSFDFLRLPKWCAGFEVRALTYDYSASIEASYTAFLSFVMFKEMEKIVSIFFLFFVLQCLATPLKPQYDGGIIVNPELNHSLEGWSSFGEAKMQHRESSEGNKFVVAHSRNQSHDSISQKIILESDKLYTFSGT